MKAFFESKTSEYDWLVFLHYLGAMLVFGGVSVDYSWKDNREVTYGCFFPAIEKEEMKK